MKTLHLIRHSYTLNSSPDISRELSQQGEQICAHMGPKIQQGGCGFEHVFVSPATRAQSTIKLLAAAMGRPTLEWHTEDALYTFDYEQLLSWLETCDDALDDIVIVGHNPGVSDLAVLLTGGHIAQVPPCTYLKIETDAEHWQGLYPRCGHLAAMIYPDTA